MQAFGELRGFTVFTAADGAAALEQARTVGVDAIVCDLRMPGMDGYAFHEQLRAGAARPRGAHGLHHRRRRDRSRHPRAACCGSRC